jgi:hypothetical protein
MLPAIGAASLAFDAIQSLTSSQSSSGAQSLFPDVGGDSDAPSSPASGTVSGFSSAQMSADNFNTLIGAQGLESGDALDSGGGSWEWTQDASASGAASSTYSAVNQLMQSTAAPAAFSAVSISA